MKNINITIVVPGLVSSIESAAIGLPVLNKFLNKKSNEIHTCQSLEDLLLNLLQSSNTTKPAYAAISALGENIANVNKYWWLRADPLMLRFTNTEIFIAENQSTSLTMAEAEILVAELNKFLYADAIQLIATQPQAWYLHLKQAPQIDTLPLSQVIGKNMYDCLPIGQDKTYWCKLLTELQMILYASEFNQRRRIQGSPTIDSLWFWGEGTLPEPTATNWQRVTTNNTFGRGLALLSNTRVENVPESFFDWRKSSMPVGNYLIVFEIEADQANKLAQQTALVSLEKNWFKPMLSALYAGQLNGVKLYDGFSSYNLKKPWWKF